MRTDEEYLKAQEAKKEEHFKNLRQMHEVNLKTEKTRLQNERKMQDVIDRENLKQRIAIQERQHEARIKEKTDMQKRNQEYEKKVALAAMGITRSRDLEKDKLTLININKQKQRDEQKHLKQHLQKEILKTQSSQALKNDLMRQMQEKRKESVVEKSLDAAQYEQNLKMDREHWDNEQRLNQERRQRRLNYEKELQTQIDEKRRGGAGPTGNSPVKELHLNKDYIENIKQIKDLLKEEINLKEAVVVPKTSGKRLIKHQQPSVSVVGLHNAQEHLPIAKQNSGGDRLLRF